MQNGHPSNTAVPAVAIQIIYFVLFIILVLYHVPNAIINKYIANELGTKPIGVKFFQIITC